MFASEDRRYWHLSSFYAYFRFRGSYLRGSASGSGTGSLRPKNRRSRAAGPFSLEADGTREEGKEGERRGKKRGRERKEGRDQHNYLLLIIRPNLTINDNEK